VDVPCAAALISSRRGSVCDGLRAGAHDRLELVRDRLERLLRLARRADADRRLRGGLRAAHA
jgi:hypothetical protein